ncbi:MULTISPECIES: hypothetical protein [unclassified Nocardia]|uniref:hypothetical protein n=1 Tax=unclassified Nocardia TaxID=2637762 RepID=UPI00278C2B8B|nr:MULTISPECIES: hypothetical protein [unclassified Nocardia]
MSTIDTSPTDGGYSGSWADWIGESLGAPPPPDRRARRERGAPARSRRGDDRAAEFPDAQGGYDHAQRGYDDDGFDDAAAPDGEPVPGRYIRLDDEYDFDDESGDYDDLPGWDDRLAGMARLHARLLEEDDDLDPAPAYADSADDRPAGGPDPATGTQRSTATASRRLPDTASRDRLPQAEAEGDTTGETADRPTGYTGGTDDYAHPGGHDGNAGTHDEGGYDDGGTPGTRSRGRRSGSDSSGAAGSTAWRRDRAARPHPFPSSDPHWMPEPPTAPPAVAHARSGGAARAQRDSADRGTDTGSRTVGHSTAAFRKDARADQDAGSPVRHTPGTQSAFGATPRSGHGSTARPDHSGERRSGHDVHARSDRDRTAPSNRDSTVRSDRDRGARSDDTAAGSMYGTDIRPDHDAGIPPPRDAGAGSRYAAGDPPDYDADTRRGDRTDAQGYDAGTPPSCDEGTRSAYRAGTRSAYGPGSRAEVAARSRAEAAAALARLHRTSGGTRRRVGADREPWSLRERMWESRERWAAPLLGVLAVCAVVAAVLVQVTKSGEPTPAAAAPTAVPATSAASDVAAAPESPAAAPNDATAPVGAATPECPAEAKGGQVRGNGPGGTRTGPDAILALQHAYYVARSGALARELVAADAAVPSAADIQAGIDTIPPLTTHCVQITPGAFAGQYIVIVTEFRPDDSRRIWSPQLVMTTTDADRTVINAIIPLPDDATPR